MKNIITLGLCIIMALVLNTNQMPVFHISDSVSAASNAYITVVGNDMKIGNSRVEIVINNTNGHFRDIWNKSLGYHFKKIDDGSWPYEIKAGTSSQPTKYDASLTYNSPQTMYTADITGAATDRKVLKVVFDNLRNNADNTFLDIKLEYIITVLDTPVNINPVNQNEYFTIKATIINNSTVNKIYGLFAGVNGQLCADGTTGWTSGGTVDGSRVNEKMGIPDWNGGSTISNPNSTLTSYKAYGNPGWSNQSLSVGWIDLYTNNKGLGIGYVNDAGMAMSFEINKNSAGSYIRWQQFALNNMPNAILQDNASATYYGLEGSGTTWTTGNWIIAPHSGDWHAMADAYRMVYYQDMGGKYIPVSDYPANFSDVWFADEYMGYGVQSPGATKQVFMNATDIFTQAQRRTSAVGSTYKNWMIKLVGFNGNGTTGGHEYGHPAYTLWGNPAGTAAQVQAAVNSLINNGVQFPGIYMNIIGNYTDANNIISGAYLSNANNGRKVLEYSTNTWQNAGDADHADWQNWFNNMAAVWRDRGFKSFKFDQLPLLAGITTNTSHVHSANNMVGTLTSDAVGKREIVKYYWSFDPTYKPYITSEMGNDVTSGYSVYWGWNGNWAPIIGTFNNGDYIHYTFPEKTMPAYNESTSGINLAKLNLYQSATITKNAERYNTFRNSIKSKNAPGVPFNFKDNIGITNNLNGLYAYSFPTVNNGMTVTLFASQAVNGNITVDMRKFGYTSSSVVIPVTLSAGDFGYAIINPNGIVTTNWNAIPGKIFGSTFGVYPAFNNGTASYEKALDGDISTYYDCSYDSGGYTGIDTQGSYIVKKIRYYPRPGASNRMLGGKFQGSNNGTSWTDINTISSNPANSWNNVDLAANTTAYRLFRYYGANNTYCNVSEIQFFDTVSNQVTGVSLNKGSANIRIGETQTLSSSIIPSNATNSSILWTTSDANVATVNNAGVVTAKGIGSAIITVTTMDGDYSANCVVTTENPIILSEDLNISSQNIITNINPNTIVANINNLIVTGIGVVKVFKDKAGNVISNDQTKVTTGTKIYLVFNGTTYNSYTIIIHGDVDGDGDITIDDLARQKQHLLRIDNLTDEFLSAGDINGNAIISISDIIAVKKHLIGVTVIDQSIF